MIRKAFIFTVTPGSEQEYIRRHNPIWSDLARVLKSHGVHNYSIFAEPGTGKVFAYVEVEDESRWQSIATTPECKKWWTHMSDIMETNPDQSPKSTPLPEVFHLD